MQGQHPSQGRAPLSGGQAPVRICQDALSRLEEKHSTAFHAVCAIEFVDGAQQIGRSTGMSAPKNRAMTLQGVKKTRVGGKNGGISGACA